MKGKIATFILIIIVLLIIIFAVGIVFIQNTSTENPTVLPSNNAVSSPEEPQSNALNKTEDQVSVPPSDNVKNLATNELAFEDLNKTGKLDFCLKAECLLTGCMFTTQESFTSGAAIEKESLACESIELPRIDFSKKSLLGHYTSASGCTRESFKHVYKYDDLKKIVYNIETKSYGSCEPYIIYSNWVLIDKIPESYSVDFKTTCTGDLTPC